MKEKKIANISSFQKGFKKLYLLTKPRSCLCIELMTDDLPDEWLIDVVKYKKKSGEISDNFIINSEDIEYWLNKFKKDGWSILT